MQLIFKVPGPCIPQSRPKAHRVGNAVVMHDVPKCISYKMDVAACAQKEIDRLGIAVPVAPDGYGFVVYIRIEKALPKSMPKYKRVAALEGKLLPLTKPDLDNAAKGILDALTSVFWKDDAAVSKLCVEKVYAEMDSVTVSITWGAEEEAD